MLQASKRRSCCSAEGETRRHAPLDPAYRSGMREAVLFDIHGNIDAHFPHQHSQGLIALIIGMNEMIKRALEPIRHRAGQIRVQGTGDGFKAASVVMLKYARGQKGHRVLTKIR